MTGFDGEKNIIDPTYKEQVLAKNRSELYASLIWLKENCAISEEDLATFEKVKGFRNRIAHELMSFLANGFTGDLAQNFVTAQAYIQTNINIVKIAKHTHN